MRSLYAFVGGSDGASDADTSLENVNGNSRIDVSGVASDESDRDSLILDEDERDDDVSIEDDDVPEDLGASERDESLDKPQDILDVDTHGPVKTARGLNADHNGSAQDGSEDQASWPFIDFPEKLAIFEFDFQELEPVANRQEESHIVVANTDTDAVSISIDPSGHLLPDSINVISFVLGTEPVILFRSIEEILALVRGSDLGTRTLAKLRATAATSNVVQSLDAEHPVTKSAVQRKLLRPRNARLGLQVVDLNVVAPLLEAILAASGVAVFFT